MNAIIWQALMCGNTSVCWAHPRTIWVISSTRPCTPGLQQIVITSQGLATPTSLPLLKQHRNQRRLNSLTISLPALTHPSLAVFWEITPAPGCGRLLCFTLNTWLLRLLLTMIMRMTRKTEKKEKRAGHRTRTRCDWQHNEWGEVVFQPFQNFKSSSYQRPDWSNNSFHCEEHIYQRANQQFNLWFRRWSLKWNGASAQVRGRQKESQPRHLTLMRFHSEKIIIKIIIWANILHNKHFYVSSFFMHCHFMKNKICIVQKQSNSKGTGRATFIITQEQNTKSLCSSVIFL